MLSELIRELQDYGRFAGVSARLDYWKEGNHPRMSLGNPLFVQFASGRDFEAAKNGFKLKKRWSDLRGERTPKLEWPHCEMMLE